MGAGTNNVIIDCRNEIRTLQRTHGSFRKNALWKYHNSIMADSSNRFMPIHTLKPLSSFPVKALPVTATELCLSMITAMDGN
jgi:hypothetical protein